MAIDAQERQVTYSSEVPGIQHDPRAIMSVLDGMSEHVPHSLEDAQQASELLAGLSEKVQAAVLDKTFDDLSVADSLYDAAEKGLNFWRLDDTDLAEANAILAAKAVADLPARLQTALAEQHTKPANQTLQLFKWQRDAEQRLNLHAEIVAAEPSTEVIEPTVEDTLQATSEPYVPRHRKETPHVSDRLKVHSKDAALWVRNTTVNSVLVGAAATVNGMAHVGKITAPTYGDMKRHDETAIRTIPETSQMDKLRARMGRFGGKLATAGRVVRGNTVEGLFGLYNLPNIVRNSENTVSTQEVTRDVSRREQLKQYAGNLLTKTSRVITEGLQEVGVSTLVTHSHVWARPEQPEAPVAAKAGNGLTERMSAAQRKLGVKTYMAYLATQDMFGKVRSETREHKRGIRNVALGAGAVAVFGVFAYLSNKGGHTGGGGAWPNFADIDERLRNHPLPSVQPKPSTQHHAPFVVENGHHLLPKTHHSNLIDGFNPHVTVESGHGFTQEIQDLAAQKHVTLTGNQSNHFYHVMNHRLHGRFFQNDRSYRMDNGDLGIFRSGQAQWRHRAIHVFNQLLTKKTKK